MSACVRVEAAKGVVPAGYQVPARWHSPLYSACDAESIPLQLAGPLNQNAKPLLFLKSFQVAH